MADRSTYNLSGSVATITMDDGKVNALSPEMIRSVAAGFDRAEDDGADAVILTGREGVFSAGFDLKTEGEGWPPMLVAGANLAARMLSFPRPVILACNGHAMAMGGFLLLSADYRIGVSGDLKIGLNEVAIGLTMPWFGIEIARHRLARPYFDRCAVTGVLLGPDEALDAGFLDEMVPAADLPGAAVEAAGQLAEVKHPAHAETKLRVREQVIAGINDGVKRIEGDGREW
ncbi:MAG: crotonase/enoyl-CoA hydratase family protein [Thermoleophilia bacterium]|nr:crotonase/enoyl-CoA hydratase family protein [Thermoleophilia bacterium]